MFNYVLFFSSYQFIENAQTIICLFAEVVNDIVDLLGQKRLVTEDLVIGQKESHAMFCLHLASSLK